MRSRILDHSRGTVFAARTIGVSAVLCWGWYIIAATRTQQFGFSAATLAASVGMAAAFVLPAAILPFIGLRWRAVARGAAATVLAALLTAEAFAAMEESGFRRATQALPPGLAVVVQARQWPFAHHAMVYDPTSDRWSAGD